MVRNNLPFFWMFSVVAKNALAMFYNVLIDCFIHCMLKYTKIIFSVSALLRLQCILYANVLSYRSNTKTPITYNFQESFLLQTRIHFTWITILNFSKDNICCKNISGQQSILITKSSTYFGSACLWRCTFSNHMTLCFGRNNETHMERSCHPCWMT